MDAILQTFGFNGLSAISDASSPVIGMVTGYVAVLQDCLQLLSWFMNNGQFPFLLYASRIFPDKKMESTVKRKL
jgi:hypothetical protein